MGQLRSSAQIFFGAVATGSCLIVASAIRRWEPIHYVQFFVVLTLSVIASRLKLKLPGLNGNMSVNLPFILIAVVELSLLEALMIALVSTVAQCVPKGGGRPKAIQTLFNASTMACAVGLAGLIFQGRMPLPAAWTSSSLLLALAGATFFLVQTLPVATIIALTEGGTMPLIWSSIVHLSFPYYVLSAGVASIVTTASQHWGWQVPLFVLAVMYGVYRSYHVYFGRPETSALPANLARAAAASAK
jgi:hypothetical protein